MYVYSGGAPGVNLVEWLNIRHKCRLFFSDNFFVVPQP